MQEILKGGGAYYISRREIEKMKKNMKKVPIIQKKSELYHKNQNKEADLFIENELERSNIIAGDMLIKKNISNKANNVGLRNNLIYKLKNLFFNIFNGN